MIDGIVVERRHVSQIEPLSVFQDGDESLTRVAEYAVRDHERLPVDFVVEPMGSGDEVPRIGADFSFQVEAQHPRPRFEKLIRFLLAHHAMFLWGCHDHGHEGCPIH